MAETPRIFVSHCAPDRELGAQIAEFFGTAIQAQLGSSARLGGGNGHAGLQQQLAQADVVVGVITSGALDSGEVPFQLGAAWALGKRVVLLLRPDDSARELTLPLEDAEAIVLGPEALIELASSFGCGKVLDADLTLPARDALAALFPSYAGPVSAASTQQQWPLDENGEPRSSSPPSSPASGIMQAGATPRGQRPGLPNREASLHAGRAVSDCVFNRDQGGPFAPELDAPFGTFLAGLDGNWATLRNLEDLDVWLEVADNLLESLEPNEEHVRFWYEVGFQLATLINLSGRELENGSADTPASVLWRGSLEALRISGRNARISEQMLDELTRLLENLRGPAAQRDYSNLGLVQERTREIAAQQDAGGLAVVA